MDWVDISTLRLGEPRSRVDQEIADDPELVVEIENPSPARRSRRRRDGVILEIIQRA